VLSTQRVSKNLPLKFLLALFWLLYFDGDDTDSMLNFLGETSGRLKLFRIKGWLLRLHSWTVCV
jgi:hypothetical protein